MNILQRLKSETQASHHGLEAALPLVKPDLSQSEYGSSMQAFSAVVPSLEARLLELDIPADFNLSAGLRASQLADDLAYLGIKAAAPVRDWSGFSRAEGFGAMYVLEGSRLGGQLIARHLASMGITPTTGGSYFTEPEQGLGKHWKAFQAAMLAHVLPAEEEAVIQGAQQTFAAFLQAWQAVSAPEQEMLPA